MTALNIQNDRFSYLKNYVVLDSEVTIRNTIGKNKASPFCPDNQLVLWGWKTESDKSSFINRSINCSFRFIAERRVLVGQNIKFDLLWDFRNAGKYYPTHVWDTQLAEYLITGQDSKMISLDKLAMKYGGTLKDDRIKEYWNSGVDTTDIPEEELVPYLEQDVLNTELVYLNQVSIAARMGLLPLIESQMKALVATTVMEFNGMKFSESRLKELHADLDVDVQDTLEEIHSATRLPKAVNVLSPQQMAAWFFGGEIKYKEHVPMLDDEGNEVLYKSGIRKGQVRYQNKEHILKFSPTSCTKYAEVNPNGKYKLDKHALDKIANGIPSVYQEVASLLLKVRAATKTQGYIKGIEELVYPDGLVHGELRHCTTKTGRLSSQNPNLQNMP